MGESKAHKNLFREVRRRNAVELPKRVMAESKEARAAARWVADRFGLPVDRIFGVTFDVHRTGYCETCGGEESGIGFYFQNEKDDLEYKTEPLEIRAGEFIQECVSLLD